MIARQVITPPSTSVVVCRERYDCVNYRELRWEIWRHKDNLIPTDLSGLT